MTMLWSVGGRTADRHQIPKGEYGCQMKMCVFAHSSGHVWQSRDTHYANYIILM